MRKRKAQVKDSQMMRYLGKSSYKKISPLNSSVDLAIYRTYKYILKENIRPVREALLYPEAFYRTHWASSAEITFMALSDMGIEFNG